jgi:hypothetical protein
MKVVKRTIKRPCFKEVGLQFERRGMGTLMISLYTFLLVRSRKKGPRSKEEFEVEGAGAQKGLQASMPTAIPQYCTMMILFCLLW